MKTVHFAKVKITNRALQQLQCVDVYFLPREQLCQRGLARRNSVRLSVCPSVRHTRAL